jgi:steroid 5-alpha reductase family enzyme
MDFILWMFIVSLAINVFMFIPAFIIKTDKLTDASYSVTFIVVAIFGYLFSSKSTAHLYCLLMIILWALRLGIFLLVRINKLKKDSRFDGMRENFYKFLGFWLLQGVTVFIILVPSILLWSSPSTKINVLSTFGIVIFIAGLFIELIADTQKFRFNKNKPKTWIDIGIWRISRHPNYLGEIILWIGVYLFVVPSLGLPQSLIALIGPAYIAVLLIFVSGIPLLEKSSEKKWGDKKEYQEYKSKVPTLIPTVSSIRRFFRH